MGLFIKKRHLLEWVKDKRHSRHKKWSQRNSISTIPHFISSGPLSIPPVDGFQIDKTFFRKATMFENQGKKLLQFLLDSTLPSFNHKRRKMTENPFAIAQRVSAAFPVANGLPLDSSYVIDSIRTQVLWSMDLRSFIRLFTPKSNPISTGAAMVKQGLFRKTGRQPDGRQSELI